MSEAELWLLLAKLAISIVVVVSASFVIEKAGPLIGALLASLPLASGPTYIFLAMEHGKDFLSGVALGSLPAMAAIACFQFAYVKLAQRWSTAPALAGSMAVWAGVAIALRATGLGFALIARIAIAAYAVAWLLVQRNLAWTHVPMPPRRWWDIPARALAVALVTGTALVTGRFVGPTAAGLVALMPTVFAPLVLILQPRIGGPNTAVVIAIALPGMIGMTIAQSAIHLTAPSMGSAVALSIALVICMSWNLGILWLKRAR